MIYELRTYTCVPGRMPEAIARFPEHALPLWEKHGIELVGFWTVVVGTSNQLIYMLRWRSLAERGARWATFQNDPAWIEARAQTEANGALVASVTNQLLEPTDFSPV